MENQKIKVAIADDHSLFRESLKILMSSFDQIEVKLEACDGIDLEKKLSQFNSIDIVLLDVNIPKQNGILTCRRILKSHPALKVIGISAFTSDEIVLKMIKAGAHGFFTKDTSIKDLEKGINEVFSGGYFFDNSLGSIISAAIRNKSSVNQVRENEITPVEMQVMKLMCRQLSSEEIATKLGLSKRTVTFHRCNLLEKTLSKNIAGIIVFAFLNGHVSYKDFEPFSQPVHINNNMA